MIVPWRRGRLAGIGEGGEIDLHSGCPCEADAGQRTSTATTTTHLKRDDVNVFPWVLGEKARMRVREGRNDLVLRVEFTDSLDRREVGPGEELKIGRALVHHVLVDLLRHLGEVECD